MLSWSRTGSPNVQTLHKVSKIFIVLILTVYVASGYAAKLSIFAHAKH